MSPIRRTSIVVGVLFVVATVAGALTVVLLGPVLDDPNLLVAVSGNESGVVAAALLDLIVGVAVVGISVMLYPILKNESEGLALGYVAARTVEAVFIGIGVFSLLKVLTLSQLYMDAGAPGVPYFDFHGTMLVEAREWIFLLAPMWIFSITALILNYLWYRTRLVPRYISVWGFLGAAWMLVGTTIFLFGNEAGKAVPAAIYVFVLPIALNEMVLAVQLLVKGFTPSGVADGAT
jgi:hypothetical protein